MEVLTLIKCGIQPTQARQFAPVIDAAFGEWAIDSLQERAAFICEGAFESMNFTHLEESTYYSTPQIMRNAFQRLRPYSDGALLPYCKNPKPFANFVYANHNGNGDEKSGDGWNYRGRGLPQLTGKGNYAAADAACKQPYLTSPDMLLEPEHATRVWGWFWHSNTLGYLLRTGGINAVSRRLNGGDNGLQERADRYQVCLNALVA